MWRRQRGRRSRVGRHRGRGARTSRRPTSTSWSRRRTARLTAQGQKFPKQGTPEYEPIKAQAVWLLVQRRSSRQEAKKLGIEVTDKEVDDAGRADEEAVLRGQQEEVRGELKKEGFTDAQVRGAPSSEQLSRAGLINKVTKDLKIDATPTIQAYFVAEHQPIQSAADAGRPGHPGRQEQGSARARRSTRSSRAAPTSPRWRRSTRQDSGTKDMGGEVHGQQGPDVPEFDRSRSRDGKTTQLSKPSRRPSTAGS